MLCLSTAEDLTSVATRLTLTIDFYKVCVYCIDSCMILDMLCQLSYTVYKDVDELSELQTLRNSSAGRAALVRAATTLGKSTTSTGSSPLAGLPAEVHAIRVDVSLGAKSIIAFI